MTACLAAISATAQTDRATVSPLLEQAIQPQDVTAHELRRFIAKKISLLPAAVDRPGQAASNSLTERCRLPRLASRVGGQRSEI